jgi:hypothetical protein
MGRLPRHLSRLVLAATPLCRFDAMAQDARDRGKAGKAASAIPP